MNCFSPHTWLTQHRQETFFHLGQSNPLSTGQIIWDILPNDYKTVDHLLFTARTMSHHRTNWCFKTLLQYLSDSLGPRHVIKVLALALAPELQSQTSQNTHISQLVRTGCKTKNTQPEFQGKVKKPRFRRLVNREHRKMPQELGATYLAKHKN